MRVIFDTNIFVSYLLTKEDKNTIVSLVENIFAGKFKLLITEDLLEELRKKITHKRYLAKMIKIGDLKDVLMSLHEIGEQIPKITGKFPSFTRDPKDDYLIAYALVGQADYLVTGDKDLLILKKIDQVKIVLPRQFLKIIKHF